MLESLEKMEEQTKVLEGQIEKVQNLQKSNAQLYKKLIAIHEENYWLLCNAIVTCFQYLLDENMEEFQNLFKKLTKIALDELNKDDTKKNVRELVDETGN